MEKVEGARVELTEREVAGLRELVKTKASLVETLAKMQKIRDVMIEAYQKSENALFDPIAERHDISPKDWWLDVDETEFTVTLQPRTPSGEKRDEVIEKIREALGQDVTVIDITKETDNDA
jgi:hypothetical protein